MFLSALYTFHSLLRIWAQKTLTLTSQRFPFMLKTNRMNITPDGSSYHNEV